MIRIPALTGRKVAVMGLGVAGLAFSLAAFFLVPLLVDWGWTTPYDDPWITITTKNLVPPYLWPLLGCAALGWVLTLALARRSGGPDQRLLLLAPPSLAAPPGYQNTKEVEGCQLMLGPAEADGILPDEFYSSANFDTWVRIDRRWPSACTFGPRSGAGASPGSKKCTGSSSTAVMNLSTSATSSSSARRSGQSHSAASSRARAA